MPSNKNEQDKIDDGDTLTPQHPTVYSPETLARAHEIIQREIKRLRKSDFFANNENTELKLEALRKFRDMLFNPNLTIIGSKMSFLRRWMIEDIKKNNDEYKRIYEIVTIQRHFHAHTNQADQPKSKTEAMVKELHELFETYHPSEKLEDLFEPYQEETNALATPGP